MQKYRNKRTIIGGISYDSQKEARYASKLELLKSAEIPGERVKLIERQVTYELIPKQVCDLTGKCIERACKYVLDFRVHYADGHIEYVDVKGFKTDAYKLKKKMMLFFHGIRIKEV